MAALRGLATSQWRLVLGVLLLLSSPLLQAKTIHFSALIEPVDDVTLTFADDSKRQVRLVQRAGKVIGAGPLAGAHMLEWGIHDLTPEFGRGEGYLVFTHPQGDIAYLRFEWRARNLATQPDKFEPLLVGAWDVVSGTGRYRDLRGAGVLKIGIASATGRQWKFSGRLGGGAQP